MANTLMGAVLVTYIVVPWNGGTLVAASVNKMEVGDGVNHWTLCQSTTNCCGLTVGNVDWYCMWQSHAIGDIAGLADARRRSEREGHDEGS